MKKGILVAGVIGLCFLVFLAAPAGAQSAAPIKLGVNDAWDYPGGQGAKRGAEMAIKAINAGGGLLGGKWKGSSTTARWTQTKPRMRPRGSFTKIRWTPSPGSGEATWPLSASL